MNYLHLEMILKGIVDPGALNACGTENSASSDESEDGEYIHWCPYCATPKDGYKEAQNRHLLCESTSMEIVSDGIALYHSALKGGGSRLWSILKILKTDMHPGDGAIIVAAMSLIKLGYAIGENATYDSNYDGFAARHGKKRLLQAAALLEFAHVKSPVNPQILLLLIRVYSYLGAGSLAMRAYKRLNLKQVQWDTLGHMLFDRISTLHPHPLEAGDDEFGDTFDPRLELVKALDQYRVFQKQISSKYWLCCKNGSYNPMFEMASSAQKLSSSISRVMGVNELRAVLRATYPKQKYTKTSHGYDTLGKQSPNRLWNLANMYSAWISWRYTE